MQSDIDSLNRKIQSLEEELQNMRKDKINANDQMAKLQK